MTETIAPARPAAPGGPVRLLAGLVRLAERIPADIHLLLGRIVVAAVFWKSARTKVDGFTITDSTYFLFREEYRVPLVPSDLAAVAATITEHVAAVLLLVGLAARLSAAALLGMTLVIQVFVYPSAWITHGLWAAVLLAILVQGPGRVSLDALLRRRYMAG